MTDSTDNARGPDWEGFGRDLLEHWPVRDVDGSELFDAALRNGLIAEIPGGYDPDQHIDAEGIGPEAGDPWYEYAFHPVRADLAPDPLGAVKVKPLVWDSGPLECVSILGKYHIGRIGCSWWLRLNNQEIDRGTSWSFEGSGEAAKAAAQADYETRIRSALEPDPQDARVAALVEALIAMLDHSGVADAGPDMKDPEDHAAERQARAALAAFDKGGKDE